MLKNTFLNEIKVSTTKSFKIRQEIVAFLKELFKRNSTSVVNVDIDERAKQTLNYFCSLLLVEYETPILSIQQGTVIPYQNSVLSNVTDKTQLIKALTFLVQNKSILTDENGQMVTVDDIQKLDFKVDNSLNFQKPTTKRPSAQDAFNDQFFYIGKNSSLQLAAKFEMFLQDLKRRYYDKIVDVNQLISQNLMTVLVSTIFPQTLILFGELKQTSLTPILFEINNLWSGVNTPLYVNQFFKENVPDRWTLFSTYDLVQHNYSFVDFVKTQKKKYFMKSFDDNKFSFYFKTSNQLSDTITNDDIFNQKVKFNKTYRQSILSVYVDGDKKFVYEVAPYSVLM